ncbi:MAG: SDR family oxidoreductase [Pseudomonadota bacterium]
MLSPDKTEASMDQKPVVLITGAATGIGAVIAHQFIEDGYRVHICDIDPAAINKFEASELRVSASVTDVGDAKSVDELFEDIEQRFGRLDVLVNNAGIAGPTAAVEDIDPADWEKTVAIDLNGVFYCSRRAIPLIKQADKGVVINMASNAAFSGFPLRAPYAACKWAIIGLTKTLAMELGPFGIRANAICPGSVSGARIDGVIARDAKERGVADAAIRELYQRQSSLRKFTSPEDVASLVGFLASDNAAMISGQAIGVDGHTEGLSNWLD